MRGCPQLAPTNPTAIKNDITCVPEADVEAIRACNVARSLRPWFCKAVDNPTQDYGEVLTPTVCLEETRSVFLARALVHGALSADGSLESILRLQRGLGEVQVFDCGRLSNGISHNSRSPLDSSFATLNTFIMSEKF
jgi:hypothetical protein